LTFTGAKKIWRNAQKILDPQPGKIHNLFNVTTLLQAFPASFPCLLHPPPLGVDLARLQRAALFFLQSRRAALNHAVARQHRLLRRIGLRKALEQLTGMACNAGPGRLIRVSPDTQKPVQSVKSAKQRLTGLANLQ
jgi:hypothetical protein